MSNMTIGRGDVPVPFGTRDVSDERYTAPREIAWWIPLVASGAALVGLVILASVVFGQTLETALGAL